MTTRTLTKIGLGFGGVLVLAGIIALSFYNYKVLMSIQADPAAQPATPAQSQVLSAQSPRRGTGTPVIIDPQNDPLAPVKHVNTAPATANARPGKDPVFTKTYETPLKSPILVQ